MLEALAGQKTPINNMSRRGKTKAVSSSSAPRSLTLDLNVWFLSDLWGVIIWIHRPLLEARLPSLLSSSASKRRYVHQPNAGMREALQTKFWYSGCLLQAVESSRS